jgi:hypothetical protein
MAIGASGPNARLACSKRSLASTADGVSGAGALYRFGLLGRFGS